MEVDEQRWRAVGRCVGPVQQTADRVVTGPPRDDLRLPSAGLEARGCATRDHISRATLRIRDRDLRRSTTTGAHRDDAGGTPVDAVVPTARHLGDRAGEPDDDQAREPVLVATQRDRVRRGGPRERTLAGTPCRFGMVVRVDEQRAGAAAAIELQHVDVPPTGLVRDVRERTRVGREAGLAHRHVGAAGDHHGCPDVPVDQHDARRGPRHRGEVPLVPRDPAAVGGGGRIPPEVGTRPALGPRACIRPGLGDVESVVALAGEEDPAVGPGRGRRGVTVPRDDRRRTAGDRHHHAARRPGSRPRHGRRRPSTTSPRGTRPLRRA